MADFENAILPSESYCSLDGSTESLTFPRVGDEVLRKRRIVVHCNQRTSVPKIDHPLQPLQPADPATSSSGSFDPPTGSFEVGTFEEALEEFERSELAQGLDEKVRTEYVALCKREGCLPHGSIKALHFATPGILIMVGAARQMKTIDVKEEAVTSIQNDLQLLERYGFKCGYLHLFFEELLSSQKFLEDCDKKEDELRQEMAKVEEERRATGQNWRRFRDSF